MLEYATLITEIFYEKYGESPYIFTNDEDDEELLLFIAAKKYLQAHG